MTAVNIQRKSVGETRKGRDVDMSLLSVGAFRIVQGRTGFFGHVGIDVGVDLG